MQTAVNRSTATVVAFTPYLTASNRLTIRDRMEALTWSAANAGPAGGRLEIHPRQPDDAPDVGDYIGIYRADEAWAVWGVARRGTKITVWHGPSGVDLGRFATMKDALAAVAEESLQPRRRR